jgi:hypothetical protein
MVTTTNVNGPLTLECTTCPGRTLAAGTTLSVNNGGLWKSGNLILSASSVFMNSPGVHYTALCSGLYWCW